MNIVKKDKKEGQVENKQGNLYIKPACDIYETDAAYLINFDIPGVDKEDINLQVEKDVLTLTAECSKKADDKYNCLVDEMVYSSFKRTFELGSSVDAEKITADYKDGTLKLTLPKKEEQKTRQIKINVT